MIFYLVLQASANGSPVNSTEASTDALDTLNRELDVSICRVESRLRTPVAGSAIVTPAGVSRARTPAVIDELAGQLRVSLLQNEELRKQAACWQKQCHDLSAQVLYFQTQCHGLSMQTSYWQNLFLAQKKECEEQQAGMTELQAAFYFMQREVGVQSAFRSSLETYVAFQKTIIDQLRATVYRLEERIKEMTPRSKQSRPSSPTGSGNTSSFPLASA